MFFFLLLRPSTVIASSIPRVVASSSAVKSPVAATPKSLHSGSSSSTASNARLQFRFADGSAHSHLFPQSATLRDAANWLLEQLLTERSSGLTHSSSSASLSAVSSIEQLRLELVYPRRTFGAEQFDRSLAELGLVPSAVLLATAVPRAGRSLSSLRSGGVASYLLAFYTILLSMLLFIFGPLLRLFERGSPSTTSSRASTTSTTRAATSASNERSGAGETDSGLRQRTGPAQRLGGQGGIASVYRPISGNVRQFRPESPDDDPSATWNGNSTQQQ